MLWIDAYDELHRPTILDMRKYLSAPTMRLLEELNRQLFQRYRVKATPLRYTQKRGWVFPYQLQGVTLLLMAILDETGFAAGEWIIQDEPSLELALQGSAGGARRSFCKRRGTPPPPGRSGRGTDQFPRRTPHTNLRESAPPGSAPEKLNQFF